MDAYSLGQQLPASGLPTANLAAKASDGTVITPIGVYAKGVAIQGSGGTVPTDLVTISVPAGITRYRLTGSTGANAPSALFMETGSGTHGAASFTVFDTAGGGGSAMTTATSGGAVGAAAGMVTASNTSTSSSLFLRQTVLSAAVSGTLSVYIYLVPLP